MLFHVTPKIRSEQSLQKDPVCFLRHKHISLAPPLRYALNLSPKPGSATHTTTIPFYLTSPPLYTAHPLLPIPLLRQFVIILSANIEYPP